MINIDLIKELREISGASISECKKVLVQTQGDLKEAMKVLQINGISSAIKKDNRVTKNGLVGAIVSKDNKVGCLIEVNCETDFLTLNEKFKNLVNNIVEVSLECNSLEELHKKNLSSGQTVNYEIINISSISGEKIELKRMDRIAVEQGLVECYTHNKVSPNVGRISTLVALNTDLINIEIKNFAKNLAMHIAACHPKYLQAKDIPNEFIKEEREKIKKNFNTIDNESLNIQINSILENLTLLDQIFIIDGRTKIYQALLNIEQQFRTNIKISNFKYFSLK